MSRCPAARPSADGRRHRWEGRLFRACCAAFAMAAMGCTSFDHRVEFHEPLVLAGQTVQPDVLNQGREAYVQYCYACHGLNGDGNGPAARTLRPPPRDLRSAVFKFAKVVEGLPHDEDLQRIVRGGLAGTAMLPWRDIPDELLDSILQYMKTLSPVWQDPEEELGERILADNDPWGADRRDEAIARGNAMYHAYATCQQCHAAYATRQEIFDASLEVGNQPMTTFRDGLYDPEAKESAITDGDYRLTILPPDFLFSQVRAGSTVDELYRTTAAGVPPVMPAWHGSMPAEEIWAIAYYVRSLIELRDTPGAVALRERLANQPAFVPPAAPGPPPTEGPGTSPPAVEGTP